MQRKTKAPHTFKDNFWSRQRVEKGMTVREIAEVLGVREKRVGMYFSGQCLPDDQFVRDICDLFDVDFHTGNLEFQHAHRAWKAEHTRKLVSSAKKPVKKTIEPEKCENKIEEVEQGKPEFNKDSVLSLLYNKVDYSVFRLIEDLLDNI